MFINDAIIRQYRGVKLSPKALITLASILYKVVTKSPIITISVYQ